MPELPEVETIARGVHARVRGERILDTWFASHREPFKTPAARLARGLAGRTIIAVHRTGKHIVFELGVACGRSSTPAAQLPAAQLPAAQLPAAQLPAAQLPAAQWIVHLGMTGQLLVTAPEAPVARHTHARLSLSGGRELRFVDPRRFGRLEFRDLARVQGFAGPGAEPLTIGTAEFAALFRGRHVAIKPALLNQKLLSGVGNIYADESLFRAGIRPRRAAGRLTRAELERLRLALRQVLQHAIRLGGSSISDYVGADGAKGFFQMEHCVYQRTGEPCRICQTPIRRIVLGGRSTHYCVGCQK